MNITMLIDEKYNEYDKYVGKGDYLTVIKDANVYINKLLKDLDNNKFRLTKQYLSVLGYTSTDYSPELIFENILSSVYHERIRHTKSKSITNNSKTVNKTKKRSNSSPNKTLKTNHKTSNPEYTINDYENAYKIQNAYRFIWYVYALYILFNEVSSSKVLTRLKKIFIKFDKLYNIKDYKNAFNLNNDIIDKSSINKVKNILKNLLEKYFINPKLQLMQYLSLKETRKEINYKSNIYVLDVHGLIGDTFFVVPEKTIIVVNTTLNKSTYMSNYDKEEIKKLLNNIDKQKKDYKNIDIYEIINNLYKLFVKKINPNATIFIPGQVINNLDLTISPFEFESIMSVKNNDTVSTEFKKLHNNKKTNTNLYKLLGDFKPFNIGNLKVIYLISCNHIFSKNINVNYIYNYFLRITSPYSDIYSYNDNTSMMEITYSFDFLNVETNKLIKSKRNVYIDLVKNILAGKSIDIIENSYNLILPPYTEYVNHIYILLIIITAYSYNNIDYYYKNHAENIDNALNFIFDKMYKFKGKHKRKKLEYTDSVLVNELKNCLELYYNDIKDYYIRFINGIIILFYDNKKLNILESIINKYKHLITLDKYADLIIKYLSQWSKTDALKLNDRLLKLLIDDKQEILFKDEFIPIQYYINICIYKNIKLDETIIKVLTDNKKEVLTIKDKMTKLTPLELFNTSNAKYKQLYTPKIHDNIVKLLTPN
jgi:hypothetical protein